MGRGVSYGGGQSSLGYLFGNGEAPKPTTGNAPAVQSEGQRHGCCCPIVFWFFPSWTYNRISQKAASMREKMIYFL